MAAIFLRAACKQKRQRVRIGGRTYITQKGGANTKLKTRRVENEYLGMETSGVN